MKMKVAAALATIFVSMPIWCYIVYTLLDHANVDRLVWFLFWVYVPVTILARVIAELAAKD